jgi:uncharacterized RDD family membrane protein YckC
MSDVSQGDGWWLASDGKWYPPHLAPQPVPPPMPAWPQQPQTYPGYAMGGPYHVAPDSMHGRIIPGGFIPAGSELASPWLRLGSYLLDVLLLVVTLGIGWLIWSIIVWQDGQTPAKRMLDLRVIEKPTGKTLTRSGMFVRDIVIRGLVCGLVLGTLTAGIFNLVGALMIFSAYHETIWDKWAGTLVVKKQ